MFPGPGPGPGPGRGVEVRVFDQGTLDIGEGEIFAVIGHSGAGRPTLVRLVDALAGTRSCSSVCSTCPRSVGIWAQAVRTTSRR